MNYDFHYSLGSDNHSGVHAKVMAAISEVNQSHAPSYGTDGVSEQAYKLFQKHFGEQAQTHFVFNGTAANVLALSTVAKSYHSIICSAESHLQNDECGAPEKFIGCKLLPIKTPHGKLTVDDVKDQLVRLGDQHISQPKVISLTQPTELGTVYSLDEIAALCQLAKDKQLYVHIDGARLIQAAYRLDCDFKSMTTDLGVDVVSFGGTKNGLLYGEAVVLLNPKAQENFKFVRKQAMQLPSKMRFMAAQFIALLDESNLWREIAGHSQKMAHNLAEAIAPIPELEIAHPVEANSVFVKIPKAWTKALKSESFFYIFDENDWVARWMMSYDTNSSDIESFVQKIYTLKGQQ